MILFLIVSTFLSSLSIIDNNIYTEKIYNKDIRVRIVLDSVCNTIDNINIKNIICNPLIQIPGTCKIKGALPDSICTPGMILTKDTSIICHQHTNTIRNVTNTEKIIVMRNYGFDPHTNKHPKLEIDHLISLELGGSNDIKNLWPETAEPRPGFHEKDGVENKLHSMVCKGLISIDSAQYIISHNWLQEYKK